MSYVAEPIGDGVTSLFNLGKDAIEDTINWVAGGFKNVIDFAFDEIVEPGASILTFVKVWIACEYDSANGTKDISNTNFTIKLFII